MTSRCTQGTGEHGVGVGKKEYLTEELGEGTVELMRTIKRAVDPLNLMNPGKVSTYLVDGFYCADQHSLQLYPDHPKQS